jgi:hypothetical protein
LAQLSIDRDFLQPSFTNWSVNTSFDLGRNDETKVTKEMTQLQSLLWPSMNISPQKKKKKKVAIILDHQKAGIISKHLCLFSCFTGCVKENNCQLMGHGWFITLRAG